MSTLVLFSPIWSTLVLFSPFNSICSTLILFGPDQSILLTLVLFSPLWFYSIFVVHFCSIQSTFAQFSHFCPIPSTLVIFHPLCPLVLFHSFGPIRSTMVLLDPFCLLWSYPVYFDLVSVIFGLFRSTLIIFYSLRPYLVHFGHFWSPSIVFGPFRINHHICHFCDCSILDIVLITIYDQNTTIQHRLIQEIYAKPINYQGSLPTI